MVAALRGRLGGAGTSCPRWRSRAGPAARWPRCTSPASQGETVLCPSNTFMATPLAAIRAGAEVQFVDCNREDLCMSFADFEAKAEQHKPRAAFLVHIGGHIAFDSERIAEYCAEHGIFLIEDCAHAHGASWNGRKPGTYGDAGVYSLYATKTISTGEGGVLVSRRPEVVEHARDFRNYGKPELRGRRAELPDERVHRRARAWCRSSGCRRSSTWKNEVARDRARPAVPEPARAARRAWSRASTSTSCSTGSSARPGASTTSPATGSWATTSSCPTPTGWRETIPAFRCTTGRVS